MPVPHSTIRWVDGNGQTIPKNCPDSLAAASQVFILTSYLERCPAKQHGQATAQVLEQLLPAGEGQGLPDGKVVLAFQHGAHDADAASRHVAAIVEGIPKALRPYLLIAVIDLHGKVNALNQVTRSLAHTAFNGDLGWVDDDVSLGPSCLENLVRHLDANPELITVGAYKVPRPNTQWAAKFFLKTKRQSHKTGRRLPHGCAILCRFDAIREGIPERYIGEDGYLSLKFFEPDMPDALMRQAVVETALCEHTVGGPVWEIIPRIRRTIHENAILLSDFNQEHSARFAEEVLFHGLMKTPQQPGLGSVPIANRFLSGLVFSFYIAAGTGFVIRGLLRRPMRRVSWSGYSRYGHPDGG